MSSQSSDDLRAQALANMRAARENLGQDTIEAIAKNIKKMEEQNAAIAEAKKRIENEMDAERAAIEILDWLNEE